MTNSNLPLFADTVIKIQTITTQRHFQEWALPGLHVNTIVQHFI